MALNLEESPSFCNFNGQGVHHALFKSTPQQILVTQRCAMLLLMGISYASKNAVR